MTKIEKIQNLLDGLEQDVRKSILSDVLDTLKDFAKDSDPDETAGLQAAIEIIEANFPH